MAQHSVLIFTVNVFFLLYFTAWALSLLLNVNEMKLNTLGSAFSHIVTEQFTGVGTLLL